MRAGRRTLKKGAAPALCFSKGGTVGKMRLAGGKRPKMVKPRADCWSDAKRELFLTELAATCNVRMACEKARMSDSAAYRERARNGAFRAGWARAISEAYVALEIMMVERAMNGTVKEIVRADGSKERITEYSDRVALQLLRHHKDLASETQAAEEIGEEDEQALIAKIERNLRGVRRGLGLPEDE